MPADNASCKTEQFVKEYLVNEPEIRVREAVDSFLVKFSNDPDFKDSLAKHSHSVKTAVFDEILKKRKVSPESLCDRCDQLTSNIHLFDFFTDKLCYRCFQIMHPLIYDFDSAVNKIQEVDENQLKLDCAVLYQKLKNNADVDKQKIADIICRLFKKYGER